MSWGTSTPPCGVKHLLDSMWLSAPQPRGKRRASVHPIVSMLTSRDLLRYLDSGPGSSGEGSRPGRTGRVQCRTVESGSVGGERVMVCADDLGRGNDPDPGARVQIRSGHTVRYDVISTAVIRSIHVAGTLSFAGDRDTRLTVGLIRSRPAKTRAKTASIATHTQANSWPARPTGAGGRHGRSPNRTGAFGRDPAVVCRRNRPADMSVHRLLRRADGLPRRTDEPHLGEAQATASIGQP